MHEPLISCICPTYNRPPGRQFLLEEAVESFLRQDYPNKELVILNDTPGQELHCEADQVLIVNRDERFPTLGEKCNALVELATGDLIAPWDDDDISLPWRLSLSVTLLGDGEYMNPRNYIFMQGNRVTFQQGGGFAHNASIYRRFLFERVGGYRHISSGYDRDIDAPFARHANGAFDPLRLGSPPLDPSQLFYIYRWGVSMHVSSASSDDGIYQQIGEQPISDGCYWLEPGWRQDYVALTRASLD